MRKVCVVVVSRANYGRIKSVLRAINEHPDLELQLVVGASALLERFGSAHKIIKNDGFKIDGMVYITIEGENPTTMAKSTGLAIVELATMFENLKPDIVLTVADRYETMATAVASSYMNIPLAHTQGGEVTGSIDESVRHAVTKLAHIHFPATKKSAERLIKMGEDPSTVFCVGCPSIDSLVDADLTLKNDIFKKYGGVGAVLDLRKPYLLVIQHPVTTEYGQGLEQISRTIKAIHELQIQIIMLWPNVDAGSGEIAKGIRLFREHHGLNVDYIHFFINFSVEDYAKVLNNSACIVGNSSSGLREGSFLGVPCVNIGTRQSGRERGKNVVDVEYDAQAIKNAIEYQLSNGRYEPEMIYGDGRAGERITNILAQVPLRIEKRLTY